MPTLTIDARLWNATGIGTFLKNLLPFLLNEKNLSSVLLCYEKDASEIAQRGFPNLIPIKSPLYTIHEQWELPLKIPKCALFWSPHFNVPVFPIRAKRRLLTIHDTYHLTFASELSVTARTYARFMYRFGVRHSDVITTDSWFSFQEIKAHCSPFSTPLEMILLGISKELRPCVDERKKTEIRNKYGLPSSFFMTISNYKPHKNLERLLQAFKGLQTDHFLVLAGKKEMVNEKRVLCLPHVSQEDLPVIYSLAKALVFPSLYEGFGFPPVEAMACGCPTLVSRVASLPEVCGEATIYVDPYSVDSIRQGIERLLVSEDDRKRLRDKGLLHAQSYRWETCAEKYLSIIRRLMGHAS